MSICHCASAVIERNDLQNLSWKHWHIRSATTFLSFFTREWKNTKPFLSCCKIPLLLAARFSQNNSLHPWCVDIYFMGNWVCIVREKYIIVRFETCLLFLTATCQKMKLKGLSCEGCVIFHTKVPTELTNFIPKLVECEITLWFLCGCRSVGQISPNGSSMVVKTMRWSGNLIVHFKMNFSLAFWRKAAEKGGFAPSGYPHWLEVEINPWHILIRWTFTWLLTA